MGPEPAQGHVHTLAIEHNREFLKAPSRWLKNNSVLLLVQNALVSAMSPDLSAWLHTNLPRERGTNITSRNPSERRGPPAPPQARLLSN